MSECKLCGSPEPLTNNAGDHDVCPACGSSVYAVTQVASHIADCFLSGPDDAQALLASITSTLTRLWYCVKHTYRNMAPPSGPNWTAADREAVVCSLRGLHFLRATLTADDDDRASDYRVAHALAAALRDNDLTVLYDYVYGWQQWDEYNAAPPDDPRDFSPICWGGAGGEA